MNPLNLPKLCGGDIELGNFLTGVHGPDGTGYRAALALLKKIKGVEGGTRPVAAGGSAGGSAPVDRFMGGSGYSAHSSSYHYGASAYDPQDWIRTYLPANGGCVYIDLDHLEICLPEVLSARDHVAAWHAMLRIAAQALQEVNADLPPGQKIHVLANNTDGHGNSYGSHLDFLITRRAWDNIFNRRLQYLLFLAAYQASSLVFAGQGKVGAEGGFASDLACPYQLSQRADFIEVLMGIQTTFNRPIVNSRDEALCGRWRSDPDSPARAMARLHVIFYDSTLCHVGSFLKVGVMQIIAAMIEAEKVNPQLILEDPVTAVGVWSRDPSLTTRAELVSGEKLSAVEVQLRFHDEASAFIEAGGCDGIVPEAGVILDLWGDTLRKLQTRDLAALAPRLDWVLKLSMLERAMKQRPELTWESPELKHLDHLYSSLDGGLYLACERQGAVQRMVSEELILRFMHEPPEDTRAYARSRLLRLAEPEQITHVDWDEITFKLGNGWASRRTVSLANPLSHTKAKTRFLETASLDDALDVLGAEPRLAPVTPVIAPPPRYPRYSTHPPKPS